jgi:hypothetical protein
MTHSFLLRFQERCEETCSTAIAMGTETTTRVMREQPDSDPTRQTFQMLPAADILSGTATNTRIRSEQGDTDFAHSARTLPIAPTMGTMTSTAVKMESGDHDPRQEEMTVLLKCS